MNNLRLNFVFIVVTCLALSACQKDQASIDLGKEYGQSKTIKDCNNRSFEILIESDFDGYSTSPSDFSFGCSLTAAYNKEYCKDIPVDSIFKSIKWMEEQCASNKDPKACEGVIKHSVSRCISGKEAKSDKKTTAKKQPVKSSPEI